MSAIFEDTTTLRKIIATVSNVLSEANITFANDGIKLTGLDDSRVSLLSLHIPSFAFQKYEFDSELKDSEIKVGLDFSQIKKVLRNAKARDSVKLAYIQEERPYFEITLFRGSVDDMSYIRTFKIATIDVEAYTLDISNKKLEYDVSIEFSSSEFLSDVIASAATIAEDIYIRAEKDLERLTFSAESDTGKFEYPIVLNKDENIVQYTIADNARAMYSLQYMKNLKPLLSIANNMKFEFSTDRPLHLSFTLPRSVVVEFLLAPRIA